jgi:PAS domain S-box-containing protein
MHSPKSAASRRSEAERELLVGEERYRILFEKLIEGFCIVEVIFDADGNAVDFRFLEANPAFEMQTGLRGVQGKLMRDLVPDHEREWFEIYGKVALTGEPAHFEREAAAFGRHYDVHAYKIGEADSRKVAILFSDITERQRVTEALRTNVARYRALFEYAPDGILIADPESRYIDANMSACRMLGYSHDELVGFGAADIVEPAEAANIARALEQINAGSNYYRKWRFRRKDGSAFPAEVIATKLPDGNLLGMFRDITEQEGAEEKNREQLDELIRWQDVMLNREDRVLRLKVEVNELLLLQGKAPRYSTPALP